MSFLAPAILSSTSFISTSLTAMSFFYFSIWALIFGRSSRFRPWSALCFLKPLISLRIMGKSIYVVIALFDWQMRSISTKVWALIMLLSAKHLVILLFSLTKNIKASLLSPASRLLLRLRLSIVLIFFKARDRITPDWSLSWLLDMSRLTRRRVL